ncbi:MAG: phosphoserine phosphatase SerB [Kangiellaceae bacterium]|nr:phosphoserine phosphatase SerB [Kangiellaceae bacterium]MCW9016786.1 phosphoserine phosphatase SerB [Kangiellaceae bacterium]
MQLNLNPGQLYFCSNQQMSSLSELPRGVSKLSIFCDREVEPSVVELQTILAQYQQEYAIKCEHTPRLKVWHIHAEYDFVKELAETLKSSSFDFLLWPEQSLQPPSLMLFDMDSTFIQIEVIDQLAIRQNVGEKVSQVTEAAMRGELDFSESLIARVACLQGLGQTAIDDIAENLPLSPGVDELVNAGKSNQCQVAIVSGGFTPFVEKLKQEMALYAVKANHLQIENGVLTGRVEGQIVDARVKAEYLQELCQALGLDLKLSMAIGDGANDLQMMNKAGFNLAYKAKPKVQQQANGRINQTTLASLIDVFGWY